MIDLGRPVFGPEGSLVGFRDTTHEGLVRTFPSSLSLAESGSGPEFGLHIYRSEQGTEPSGLLVLALRADPPRLVGELRGARVEPAFADFAFVRVRGPQDLEGATGRWEQALYAAGVLRLPGLGLSPALAGVLAGSLLDRVPADLLAVEAILVGTGLRRGWPATSTLRVGALSRWLATQLPSEVVPGVEVRAAVRSFLQAEAAAGQVIIAGAGEDRDQAREEIAWRVLEGTFEPETPGLPDIPELGARYRRLPVDSWPLLRDVRPNGVDDARIRISLAERRSGPASWRGEWRLSDLWNELTAAERESLISKAIAPEPFTAFGILVASAVPADGDRVRRVRATVRRLASRLDFVDKEISFEPGARAVETFHGIRPGGIGPAWTYSSTLVLGAPDMGGFPPPPLMHHGEGAIGEALLLKPQQFGIRLVRVEAEPRVLALAEWLDVETDVDRNAHPLAHARLDRERPGRWLVLPAGGPVRVRATTRASGSSEPTVLRDWEALVTSRFVVTEAHLAVDAEAIRIEIVDRPQRPVAIVIVRFKAAWEANWRTVSLFPPGERERSIPVRRPSALVPLAWQSQSTWILAGDGQPAERRQGAVVAGTGLTVGVELPPA